MSSKICFNSHFFVFTKSVHFVTHSRFFKSILSAEKLNLWWTFGQEYKLRRNSFGKQKAAVFFIPGKFGNVSLNQSAKVHCSLAGSQQYSCPTFVHFVPIFPKNIDYQLSLDHLFFSHQGREILHVLLLFLFLFSGL